MDNNVQHGISLKELDYENPGPGTKGSNIIRSVSVIDGDLSTVKMWIETEQHQLESYKVGEGDTLYLQLSGHVCPVCHRKMDSLQMNMCSSCWDPNDPFSIRMGCLFQDPSSLLVTLGCTKENPPCGNEKNVKYCYSPHVLYITRIGSIFKIGTSRKSRRGGFKQRLIEQGSNEAYVILLSDPMPVVFDRERSFIDMGMVERIYFEEKVDQYKIKEHMSLQGLYPLPMIEEVFPKEDIIYHQIYDDYHETVEVSTSATISGLVIWIQGHIMVVRTGQSLLAYDMKKWYNRGFEHMKINQETIA